MINHMFHVYLRLGRGADLIDHTEHTTRHTGTKILQHPGECAVQKKRENTERHTMVATLTDTERRRDRTGTIK